MKFSESEWNSKDKFDTIIVPYEKHKVRKLKKLICVF